MRKGLSVKLIFLSIFLLAAFFRLYGINWDQGQHLHPDERFLTMVATGIQWPNSWHEYLDTVTSPLNPHNKGFGFFVYGTFPIFFTKLVAESLNAGDYGRLTLIGRQLSALFDLGTVMLVYLIAKQIISKSEFLISKKIPNPNSKLGQLEIRATRNFPLLSMFFYSCMVLPIQLSHFYAVDTYLTFFITLSFYLLTKILLNPVKKLNTKYVMLSTILGVFLGLSIASKISALYFSPVIILGFLLFCIRTKNIKTSLFILFIVGFFAFITIRLAQPYLFDSSNILDIHLNPKVLENWKQLKSFDGPQTGFPPALQWIPTKPYIYPLTHMSFWGLGCPLGTLAFIALIYSLYHICRNLIKRKTSPIINNPILALILIYILTLFAYQAGQFAKPLRYLYPLYPFFAIIIGWFINQIISVQKIRRNKYFLPGIIIFIFITIAYPFAFMSIYSKPHSRVQASEWIYQNIPYGSKLSVEHWDDGLPLSLPGNGLTNNRYQFIEFPLYGPDSIDKWQKMGEWLSQTDYVILTSNRLWRSLSALPNRFPSTGKYYQALFDGSLGFKQVAVFSSYPCLLPMSSRSNNDLYANTIVVPPPITFTATSYCKLALNDDGAEESFTVYDHPKVIIFQKTDKFSIKHLYEIIGYDSI